MAAVAILLVACGVLGADGRSPLQDVFDSNDRSTEAPDFRHNWCDIETAVRSGDLELRNALMGQNVSSILEPNMWWVYEIDEDPGVDGHIVQVLEELSRRAGFEWRNHYVVSDGLTPGEDYTGYAVWHASKFDILADWFVDSPIRRNVGLVFPYNWIDLSVILVSRPTLKLQFVSDLFAFLRPFEMELWFMLIFAVIYSALVFWYLEHLVNPRYSRRTNAEGIEVATFYAAAKLTWSGHFQPSSTSGRIFAVSWAIVSLCFFASYTARLASSFIGAQQMSDISSLQEANSDYAPVCVWAGTIQEHQIAEDFPAIRQVLSVNETMQFNDLRDGKCVGMVTTVFSWDIRKGQDVNHDCSFAYLGRPYISTQGGFVMNADYFGKCTGLLATVVALHMSEMDDDGFFERIRQERIKTVKTNDCEASDSGGADTSMDVPDQLTIYTMGGLFITHFVISVICVILAVIRRPETVCLFASDKTMPRKREDGKLQTPSKQVLGEFARHAEETIDELHRLLEKQHRLSVEARHLFGPYLPKNHAGKTALSETSDDDEDDDDSDASEKWAVTNNARNEDDYTFSDSYLLSKAPSPYVRASNTKAKSQATTPRARATPHPREPKPTMPTPANLPFASVSPAQVPMMRVVQPTVPPGEGGPVVLRAVLGFPSSQGVSIR